MLAVFVVNTSPLIHLAEADRLDLLRDAAETVWVPQAVADEIETYGADDPTARALATNVWLEIKPIPAIAPEILAWDLGSGESAVLALTKTQPNAVAVIDDLAGRRCAQALGLRLKGTVGLVLAAKRAGRITHVAPLLEHLRERGMYLSDGVFNQILTLAEEA